MRKRGLLCILCIAVLLLSACGIAVPNTDPIAAPKQPDGDMTVHVIDVGQGDSTFVEFPNGQSMLIDAGERDYGSTVENYIRSLGYSRLDYVVGSHPHSDHIGGLARVIEAFEVGEIWMPNKASTTATFENLLKTIQNKGLSVRTARAGKVILSTEDIRVKILSPVKEEYGDEMNLYSAVIKITYGNQRFLIMGDAEEENEEEMEEVRAEFIRVGHHGSKTSSSQDFVDRVSARYAVISVGQNNSYGLPKEEIISRWQQSGAAVYRTDEVGTVIAHCDGKSITIESKPTSQQAPQTETKSGAWVLNISSKKIHRPDCFSAATMKESNRRESDQRIEALLAEGYTACSNCDPAEN